MQSNPSPALGFRAIQEARLASHSRGLATIYAFIIVAAAYGGALAYLPLEYVLGFAALMAGASFIATALRLEKHSGLGLVEALRAANTAVAFPISCPLKFLRTKATELLVRLDGRREAREFKSLESSLSAQSVAKTTLHQSQFGLLLRSFETDFRELVVDREAFKREHASAPLSDPVTHIVSNIFWSFGTTQFLGSLTMLAIEVSDSFGTRPVEFYDWLASASADIGPLLTVGTRKDAPFGGPNYLAVDESEWKKDVTYIVGKSAWVFFVPSLTDGVLWEAQHIFETAVQKTIIVMLPSYTIDLSDEAMQISSQGFRIIDPDVAKLSHRERAWSALIDIANANERPLPNYEKEGGLLFLDQDNKWVKFGFPNTFREVHEIIRRVSMRKH